MAGRRGPGEISEVRVTGRDGATALVRVSVPPPECPPAEAPVEKFDDAMRKRVIHAMMADDSIQALQEGLRAPRLEERRRWWQLGLQHLLPVLQGGQTGTAGGGVRISFTQNVPAPAHEDGPLANRRQPAIDVTQESDAEAD